MGRTVNSNKTIHIIIQLYYYVCVAGSSWDGAPGADAGQETEPAVA